MKVKKSHLQIALVLLVVAVVWSLSGYLRSSGPPSAAPARSSEPLLGGLRQEPSGQERATVDPLSIPAPPAIDLARAPVWGRDPFLFGSESRDVSAPVMTAAVSADPIVRSILFSSSRRVALIGNRVVGIGDSAGSFKVADIEKTAVVFTSATGERRRVGIHGPSRQGLSK